MTKLPRTSFFGFGIAGSLVAGMGALATWRTTDFAGGVTTIKGTDLVWGDVALALAVICIVVVLVSRVGSTEEPRRWATVVPLPVGLAMVLIGAFAFSTTSSIYGDGLTDEGRQAVVEAGEVLARGPGPLLLVIGGTLLLMASAAGLRWVQEWKASQTPEGTPEGSSDAPDPGTSD